MPAKKHPSGLLWFSMSLFGIAVLVQVLTGLRAPIGVERLPSDAIPNSLPTTKVHDLQISATESVDNAIKEGLGFDDYRYREYTHGGKSFTVYLAYWRTNTRHFLDVATHAPDNCWVANGFTLLRKSKMAQLVSDEQKLWPAEYREFGIGGEKIHVIYWHLVDGEPLDYTSYRHGKTLGFLLDNSKMLLRGAKTQYFLRISSITPFSELTSDPAFKSVLAALASKLPLVAKP